MLGWAWLPGVDISQWAAALQGNWEFLLRSFPQGSFTMTNGESWPCVFPSLSGNAEGTPWFRIWGRDRSHHPLCALRSIPWEQSGPWEILITQLSPTLISFAAVCLSLCFIFFSVYALRAKKLEALMLGESLPCRHDCVGGWLISFWHLFLNTQLLCTAN